MSDSKTPIEKPGPLMMVRWLDHWDRSEWHRIDPKDDFTPMAVDSIGWLAHETDTTIVLQAHIAEGGSSPHSMAIAKVGIVEMWRVDGLS